MATDQNMPRHENSPEGSAVPPPLPTVQPPAIGVPAQVAVVPPPIQSPAPSRKSSLGRQLLAILLSLCLGLFLADAVISLLDDSLILFFKLRLLTAIRGLVLLGAVFVAFPVYCMMGLTPMIPKRFFLPVTLFNPFAGLAAIPLLILFYQRMQLVAWSISLFQFIVALLILYRIQRGFKLRWLPVGEDRLGARRFSWLNLSGFVLGNVFVLLPAVAIYLALCAAWAVAHFSEGFVALRSGGVAVQVRNYVRADGKTIQLVPMSHIADSAFYRKLSQSFPSNSLILMEGVTDDQNLLTNKITYERAASSLGLTEQVKEFHPSHGEMVHADVDVEEFSTNTIGFLNLVMLVHAKGLNPENLLLLVQYSPPANVEELFLEDLLRKRNRHLLEEIHSRLLQSERIIVPWGAAHMPEIAREIQKAGFRLDESQEYLVIKFRSRENKTEGARQGEAGGSKH